MNKKTILGLLKAINLFSNCYIAFKVVGMLYIGSIFLIASYAGSGRINSAGWFILAVLLVTTGVVILGSIFSTFFNMKLPYRKKAIVFSLLTNLFVVACLLLFSRSDVFSPVGVAAALSLGSALGIFALSYKDAIVCDIAGNERNK